VVPKVAGSSPLGHPTLDYSGEASSGPEDAYSLAKTLWVMAVRVAGIRPQGSCVVTGPAFD
jgi:hypothetical protein